jgi:hypothetical protein
MYNWILPYLMDQVYVSYFFSYLQEIIRQFINYDTIF